MNVMNRPVRTMNELASKQLLRAHNITTTLPVLVTSAGDVVEAVRRTGSLCALKVVSTDIVHKAAAGGVKLSVAPEMALECYTDIISACSASHPHAQIEGILVEPMVLDGREIFIGARVTSEFGPVVLVGPGGTGVEQGKPPVAGLAPIDERGAYKLIDRAFPEELAIRSEAARTMLAHCILSVAGDGGIITEQSVGELDINPLVLTDSDAVAVDAVIVESDPSSVVVYRDHKSMEKLFQRRADKLQNASSLFEPQAIAFVGASNSKDKLNYRMLKNLVDFGFRGKVYPIHPSADRICGLQAYPSVSSVPDEIDRALVAVRTPQVPTALAECRDKGVKIAQVLTAGFSEFEAGASELEQKVLRVVADSSMRVVGPNCIGAFSAESRMPICAPRYNPTAVGHITFFSQSGTYCGDVVRRAQVSGLPVGRALSCGNCLDLDPLDFLMFANDDPSTEIVAFYIESLRDPGLFFRYAGTMRKPVILLRGGTTAQGHSAASSHTAALSSDSVLWKESLEESGVIEVHNVDELMDTLEVLSVHGVVTGNRLALFGSGGGISVTAADCAARVGLTIPPLAETTGMAMRRYGNPGTSISNPIDIPVWGLREDGKFIFSNVIDALKADANVDRIVVFVDIGWIMDFVESDEQGEVAVKEICASIVEARRDGSPVSLALRTSGDLIQAKLFRDMRLSLRQKGISVFTSTTRAILAHSRVF